MEAHRYEPEQLLKQAQQFAIYMHGRRWGEKHEKAVEAYLKRNSCHCQSSTAVLA